MAAQLDLVIEQGATFTLEIALIDDTSAAIDLSGYTARMSIKRSASDALDLLELTTANNRIIITGATGLVTLVLTAAETTALEYARGVYDLELISATGVVMRVCEGSITVSAEVTA